MSLGSCCIKITIIIILIDFVATTIHLTNNYSTHVIIIIINTILFELILVIAIGLISTSRFVYLFGWQGDTISTGENVSDLVLLVLVINFLRKL